MSWRGRAGYPHVVYRCYDAEGLLLYIGHTYEVTARFRTHRNSTNPAYIALMRWMVRLTEVEYPTKAEAGEVEKRAIWHEQPLLNTRNQRVANRPASRLPIIAAYVAYAEQREADALASLAESA